MQHARSDYDDIQDPRGRIPDDEPVFLIRAQDQVGFMAVLDWAKLAEDAGVDPVMVQGVREHAARMRQWQIDHGCKVPDVPKGAMRIESERLA